MNIGAEVAGFLVRLVQLGIAASEEQAKEMILAHLQASPPDIAKTYFDARGSVMARRGEQDKSDADELKRREVKAGMLGLAARESQRDTLPSPPPSGDGNQDGG